jgi:hypothetical protein
VRGFIYGLGVVSAIWLAVLVAIGVGAGLYAGGARLLEWHNSRTVRRSIDRDLARFYADVDALVARRDGK